MSSMIKIAIAALVAGAAAMPANVARSSMAADEASMSTLSTVTSTASSGMSTSSGSSSSATSSGSGMQESGFPTFVDPIGANEAASLADLAKKMEADVTQVDRLQTLLSVGNDGKTPLTDPEAIHDAIAFDFKRAPEGGKGGRILVANEKNFPFLVGEDISGAVAFIEPCGMNSPHTHPRATEFLTVVQGELETGFVMENNFFAAAAKGINALALPFNTTLKQFESTIFPQGSIHFQFNPTCERAIFAASLNSADPGTSQVAQNFFTLDDKIVNVTLGAANSITPNNVDQFRANLPPNLVSAVQNCKATCGY